MKILRLDLRAFGPFTGVSLDLSGGNEGLHLIYGPNEAGKSSSLRALGQLLFGIPGNSGDNFVHPYRDLRIGALLARRDGRQVEILRRKGNKDTLLAADDKTPLDDAELRAFLGGCDQGQFDTMFGINHRTLVAGGQDIIRGEGEVGHVLFAAGAGIADLRTIRGNLESEADNLFSPRAHRPAINQTLSALKEARQKIREAQLPSAEWVKHRDALNEAGKRLADLERELQRASREKTRLERIAGALPVIGKRKDLQRQLAEIGDVPRLAPNFSEQRREAFEQQTLARQDEQTARETLAQIAEQIKPLAVPEGLLDQTEAIEALNKALGAYRKAQADLPGLLAKRQQLEKDARETLAELRPDLPLEAAGQLRLARRQQVDIQNLGARQAVLQKQLEQARREIRRCQNDLAEAQSQLAELPPPRDARPLGEAIRHLQGQGDLEQQLAAARAELQQSLRQAEVDLQRLGLWSGTLKELERLASPGPETVDRFDQELTEARQHAARNQDHVRKAQETIADLDRRIEELRLGGEVPTEDDLVEARRVRDAGWRLVLQWQQAGEVDAAALAEFTGRFAQGELTAAYEQAVRAADDVADRLRREANRVASRATLQASRLSSQQQATALAESLEQSRQRVQEIEQAWQACWQPLGIQPLWPREMRAWLQRQQGLLQLAQAIRVRQGAIGQLADRIASHRQQLAHELEAIGEPGATAEDSLAAMVGRCAGVVERIEGAANSRRQLDRDIAKLTKSLTEAKTSAEQAEADLADWQGRWVAAIEPLGMPGDATPAAVNEVAARTAELLERLKQVEGFAERIEGIGEEARRFHGEVERVARQVDGELVALPAEQAVEQMVARLRKATADRQKLHLLLDQRKQQDEKQAAARRTVDEMAARLATLCQDAGCAGPDDLPRVERLSEQAARLRAELQDREDELLRLAAGAALESFVAEAEAVPPDELPAQLRQLEQCIRDLDGERGTLQQTIGGEKRELAMADVGAAAAEAAEDVEDLLAKIEPDVRQYVRLRLAAAVLREGIESYRKKNEGPVLARASELFRRLTVGSFEGLRIDFDDRGEQVLAGLRPGGHAVLPHAMSEGASDQLYLALRLASLETWLARNEPIPFIVDDILISFDNERAAATLEVLAELSRQTQVIFFTHHAHLVEAARRCVPTASLFVHELRGRPERGAGVSPAQSAAVAGD